MAGGQSRLPTGFRLLRELSESATVRRRLAEDAYGRTVVVEQLPPGDGERPARLRSDTARAMALGHPHVLPVLDVVTVDTDDVLVTAFTDGPDLAGRLAGGTLPAESVASTLGPVAEVLDTAHRVGLVHRGLEPGAVLLTPAGSPCVRGFGVAPPAGAAAWAPREYLAPEQLAGGGAGPAADVHAFGALAYRCLTGRAPGAAPAPAASSVAPDLPRAVDDVLARAMAEDPARRPERCREVLDGLVAALAGAGAWSGRPNPVPVPFPPAPPPATPYPADPPTTPARQFAGVGETMIGPPPPMPPSWGGGPPTPPPGTPSYGPTPPPYGGGGPAHAAPPRKRRRGAFVALGVVAVLVAVGLVAGPRLVTAFWPGSAELDRVPVALRGACDVGSSDPGPPNADRKLTCRDNGQDVTVGLFESPDAAEQSYRAAVTAEPGAKPGAGDCADGPGVESDWPGVGRPAGRVLCVKDPSGAHMTWLDRGARTVSTATRPDGSSLELYRAWSRWVAIPPFPTADEKAITDQLTETGCRRAPAATLDGLDGALAAVSCPPLGTGAAGVTYTRFSDLGSLQAAYKGIAVAAGSPPDRSCFDPAKPDQSGDTAIGYPIALGRAVCSTAPGGKPAISWSTEGLRLLGRAIGSGDRVALDTYYRSYSGPKYEAAVEGVNTTLSPPFPDGPEKDLFEHVPTAIRPFCSRPEPDDNVSGSTAGIVCAATTGTLSKIAYVQFPDAAGPNRVIGRDPTGPDCQSNPPQFNGVAKYTRADGSTGILNCYDPPDGNAYINWSVDGKNIYAIAYGSSTKDLITWWQTQGGPI